MGWILIVLYSLMFVSLVGMISCLPGMARERKKINEILHERDIQHRIDATSWSFPEIKKGKYRRRNPTHD